MDKPTSKRLAAKVYLTEPKYIQKLREAGTPERALKILFDVGSKHEGEPPHLKPRRRNKAPRRRTKTLFQRFTQKPACPCSASGARVRWAAMETAVLWLVWAPAAAQPRSVRRV